MTNYTNQQIREKQAQDYLAEREARNPVLTPSRTYTNATTEGYYTGHNMQSARAEADDNHLFLSLPMAAQIVPHTNTNSAPAAV